MSNNNPKSDLSKNTVHKPDCPTAACELLARLDNAEKRAKIEGWIDADELDKELGLTSK